MRRRRLKDEIQWKRNSLFAPFVNVLLVLMATIAVCVSLSASRRLLDLNLAGCGCILGGNHDTCQVTLTATGNHAYYWNEQGPIPLPEFREQFARWLKTAKQPGVIIAADDTARFGDAVGLLDEVRVQGITRTRLDTRTRPAP